MSADRLIHRYTHTHTAIGSVGPFLRQGTAGRNQIFGQNIDFRFLTVYDAIIPNLHVHVAINSLCVLYYINKDI